jgi:hypothetical protein
MDIIPLDITCSFFSSVPDSQWIEGKVYQIENVKRGNILMSPHTIMQVGFFILNRLKGDRLNKPLLNDNIIKDNH